jgi:hypothetical protein
LALGEQCRIKRQNENEEQARSPSFDTKNYAAEPSKPCRILLASNINSN